MIYQTNNYLRLLQLLKLITTYVFLKYVANYTTDKAKINAQPPGIYL